MTRTELGVQKRTPQSMGEALKGGKAEERESMAVESLKEEGTKSEVVEL